MGTIASGMVKKGYKSITAEDCDRKWRNIKWTYQKVKDHNSKSGNGRKDWERFDDFDILFANGAFKNSICSKCPGE